MKKSSRPKNGWSSKTKQVARKTVLTAEQERKEDMKERKIGTSEERSRQRELANAKRLLGETATVRKSERAVVARCPEKGMVFFD